MFKVVWRFNLREGIDEAEFFAWLKANVWASSARYGCSTVAFRLNKGPQAYSTEATWPSSEARRQWAESDGFRAITPFPGTESPWAAQVDLEAVEYRPIEV